jgi:hypothetical protein
VADAAAPTSVTEELPAEVDHLELLAGAFAYGLQVSGGAFHAGGFQRRGESPWPPPLSEITPQFTGVWSTYASAVTAPVVRARLNDLLFEARHGNRRDHARAAAEAYLDATTQAEYPINAVPLLERALELTIATRQNDLRDRAVERMLADTGAALDGTEWAAPGVTLGLLEPLVKHNIADAEVGALLVRARDVYSQDPHIMEDVLVMMRRQAGGDADNRRALDRERIQSWLNAALIPVEPTVDAASVGPRVVSIPAEAHEITPVTCVTPSGVAGEVVSS